MVEILKVASKDQIKVRGYLGRPQEVIERVFMPTKKKLVAKTVTVSGMYRESEDATVFHFIASDILDYDFVQTMRKWLQKRQQNGRAIDRRVLVSRIGKRLAEYVHIVYDNEGRVDVRVESERLIRESIRDTIDAFCDCLMQEYDGCTPQEMARDFNRCI